MNEGMKTSNGPLDKTDPHVSFSRFIPFRIAAYRLPLDNHVRSGRIDYRDFLNACLDVPCVVG